MLVEKTVKVSLLSVKKKAHNKKAKHRESKKDLKDTIAALVAGYSHLSIFNNFKDKAHPDSYRVLVHEANKKGSGPIKDHARVTKKSGKNVDLHTYVRDHDIEGIPTGHNVPKHVRG